MLRCWRLQKPIGALSRLPAPPLRTFSSSPARNAAETITIPCRSNGTLTVDIHHPVAPPSLVPTVMVYLPRGPLLPDEAHDASNITILRSVLPCHIVQINYRWGTEHSFPSPMHDVLAGYDWIVSNLLIKRAITRVGRAERVGRIAVCGELVGGQLATSLALTECRVAEAGVVAATVNDPIIDWTELDDLEDIPNTAQALTTQALLKQRNALFRKNEHWFDIFASPALLFRSAGIEVPKDVSLQPFDDMGELARLDREEFFREQVALGSVSSLEEPTYPPLQREEHVRKRKASRRFPSKSLGLRLPSFRITTGEESPLVNQAMELAHLIRQSSERQNEAASHGRTPIVHQPVQYVEKPGTGLWDTSNAGRASMYESASWLARTLSR